MFHDPPKKYEDPIVLKKILDEVKFIYTHLRITLLVILYCCNFQITSKMEFSKTVQIMDEAISINPLFVKKTNSEDDGLTLGQGSSKNYQT